MKKTGLTIGAVGAIQLVVSTFLLIYLSQMSGASFAHYWHASGWTIWYPQYLAGFTLVVVGLAVAYVAPMMATRETPRPH
ncbi:hypothetical protein [Salinisphaera sp. Q1T1-3]|uniref:hypothetical protein n=1 Tax=Salinisphaera sp. Q1T1-3 TaxID=2321229 RepID=UPI000E72479B|nr:hypothetical protein [Salinisphaera sp. Q1T1-3]RJS91673.1 hypothetical protein D3260_14575 [Salinisphaera sp. Q1T1-3]